MQAYEDSLKYYRDLKNSLDTAHDDGYKEGKMEGIKEGIKRGEKRGIKKGIKQGEKKKAIEIAKNMLSKGIDFQVIADVTELTFDEIKELGENI
jgi:predicted transposase/invertase (TIGR01784 family)